MKIRECFALLVLIIITRMHSQLQVLADQDLFDKVDGREDLIPIFADDAPEGFCMEPAVPSNGIMQCGKLAFNTKKYVCIGGCDVGFEFPNKKTEGKITCDLTTNKWSPGSKFPDCVKKIICDPPCQNGGSCINENVCSCRDGFTGKVCKQRLCTPPCQNEGTCLEKNTCSCSPRFEGNRCEKDICKDPPKPLNGKMKCSKLISDANRFACTAECEEGYVFPNGDKKAKHTCDSKAKTWTPSYEFPNCQVACNPPCQNGGSCEEGNKCSCTESFEGDRCEKADCNPPCQNGGRCEEGNTCSCTETFEGDRCEKAQCNPPCQNGGSCEKGNKCRCTETFEGGRCEKAKPSECQDGWTEYFNTDNPKFSDVGDDESLDRIRDRRPVCTGGVIKDIECKVRMNRRLVDYKEVGTVGLKCSKDIGFICNKKIRQKKCEDFTVRFLCDCAVCNSPCQNGGTCGKRNQCVCPPGFDGDTCENVVCNPPCQNGGSCLDGNICVCPPGFDGDMCEDDICKEPPSPRNGKMRCSKLINDRNRFACTAECEEGYQFPNGENNTKHTCDLGAKAWTPQYEFPDCEAKPPELCKEGWTEYLNTDNPKFSDIGDDESLDRIKDFNELCAEGIIKDIDCKAVVKGKFVDFSGWDMTGLECSKDTGFTCNREERGECEDFAVRFLCRCPVCKPPCQNGGSCVEGNLCACTPSFDGDKCENDICKEPPRPRNAKMSCSKLTNDRNRFTCTAECEEGYHFPNGEDEARHTCDLGAKAWTPQYEFPDCEEELPEGCREEWTDYLNTDNPKFSDIGDDESLDRIKESYSVCTEGFIKDIECKAVVKGKLVDYRKMDMTGLKCSKDTGFTCNREERGECEDFAVRFFCGCAVCNSPCQNGGTCGEGNQCVCPPGFAGETCENVVCNPPCQNGGSCVNGNQCVCPSRFDGERCENDICKIPPSPLNGKMRCSKLITDPRKFACVAECEEGYQFPNGENKASHTCDLRAKAWTPQYEFPDCEAKLPEGCKEGWTEYFNTDNPKFSDVGDDESLFRINETHSVCTGGFIQDIECKAVVNGKLVDYTDMTGLECSTDIGFMCNKFERGGCEDFTVRFLCGCGVPEPTTRPVFLPQHMCPEVPQHILNQCPPSCPPGFACFEYACVPKDNCPCFRNGTNLTPTRSRWINEKCENCICRIGGNSRCEPTKCPGCFPGEISFIDSKCHCRCINCSENTVFCKETEECIEKELLCNGAAQCPGIEITCPREPPLTELPPSINPMNCSTDQLSETDTCEILGSVLKTFDGYPYQYEACNHILMKELMFELFSVTVRKICSPESHANCYRHLIIEVDGLVITLGPGADSVTVKNTRIPVRSISLVSKKFPGIELERSGNTLVFRSLKYNFEVTWDKMENSKIKVSECLLQSIAGLCGFYDRNLEGDMNMSNGRVAHSDQEFGDSWAIGSLEKCSQPNYTLEISNNASAACVKLREKPFKACYGRADLNRKVQACVMFMRECIQRSIIAGTKFLDESEYEKCKCYAYESFTEDCEIYKKQPSQEWRILHDCVSTCPHGMEWQDCGPGCELTCDNYRQRSKICTSNCVPGCYCPSGLVRHQNQCVKPKRCQDCICRGHGDPNYITFDGRYYSFQGTCSYILAQHTTSKDKTVNFQVIGNNAECSEEPKAACMQSLKIYWNGHIIEKYKYRPVYIDRRVMRLNESPYDKEGISITYVHNKHTLVHIKKINLVVRYFDQIHGFTIELPSFNYYNKTEGLCGVCNFNESDDFYHRGGFVTKDTEEFAYSWLVEGQRRKSCELERVDVVEPPPGICNFTANPCDTILDPSPFLKSCQNDVRYSRRLEISVCRSKFQYAQQCCERGVPLGEWLKFSGCVSSCPAGMVYKCTSACPKTCENYKTYREDDCPIMPQNTCVCPEDEVMRLGKCVKTTACEVCDDKGHMVGDVWQVGPCKICECLPNLSTKCTVHECPDPPMCGERETLQKMKGRIATCCDSYKCVPKVGNCEVPKLETCPPGRSLVLKHSNNCPVYRCECLTQLCPPTVTPFLDDGESFRLVTTDCCPEVQLTCNPNSCGPPPNCTQGFKLSTEKARCCFKHKCVPQANVCIYQHQYDVVNGTQVKLPLEKYYDKEYQPESTWHDGLCRECTCVNIKGQLLSRCKLELCQYPADFPDSEKYIRAEIRIPGSCCPKYRRKLCVDQGANYRIGQEWPSPSRHHLCSKISRCVRDNTGEAVIEVTTECEKPCER